jgi:hypothetical protein
VGILRKGRSTQTIHTVEVLLVPKGLQVKEESILISHELQIESKGKYETNETIYTKKNGKPLSIMAYLGTRIGRKQMSCSSKNRGSQDYLVT